MAFSKVKWLLILSTGCLSLGLANDDGTFTDQYSWEADAMQLYQNEDTHFYHQ
jgi:hypothetical protein